MPEKRKWVEMPFVLFDVIRWIVMYGCIYLFSIQFGDKAFETALYLTNFMNVPRYMMLYYYREGRELSHNEPPNDYNHMYESFKRDAVLYRQVNFWIMAYAYYTSAGLDDWLSIGIAMVGFFIGNCAYLALGHNGTYYGFEMRLPEFVQKNPDGTYQTKRLP